MDGCVYIFTHTLFDAHILTHTHTQFVSLPLYIHIHTHKQETDLAVQSYHRKSAEEALLKLFQHLPEVSFFVWAGWLVGWLDR